MSSSSDIRSKAKQIYYVHQDVTLESNSCQGTVSESETWWQSVAGQVLRTEYAELNKEISDFQARLIELESAMYRLASRVDQVEEERRLRNMNTGMPYGTTRYW